MAMVGKPECPCCDRCSLPGIIVDVSRPRFGHVMYIYGPYINSDYSGGRPLNTIYKRHFDMASCIAKSAV